MAELKVNDVSEQIQHTEAVAMAKTLGLARISIVKGGPSVSDPMGEVQLWVGFLDKRNNGIHFGLGENYMIVRAGGTINGKRFTVPIAEEVKLG